MESQRVNSIISGRSPPLYCTLTLITMYVGTPKHIVSVWFLLFVWGPCMAINVSVQYNGGFLPDIILLTQCQ